MKNEPPSNIGKGGGHGEMQMTKGYLINIGTLGLCNVTIRPQVDPNLA